MVRQNVINNEIKRLITDLSEIRLIELSLQYATLSNSNKAKLQQNKRNIIKLIRFLQSAQSPCKSNLTKFRPPNNRNPPGAPAKRARRLF